MQQTRWSPTRTRRVKSGAITLNVSEFGESGPRLILLHGIGSRGISWLPVIDQLTEEHQLIVPDLRGHGASDKPAAGYLTPDYAVDLGGLIDAYGIDRPLIIGHSLGGMIAWRWASENPDRAAKIVIEDSPLRGGSSRLSMFDDWIELSAMTPGEAAARYHRDHPDWSLEDCEWRGVSITLTTPAVFTEMRALQASYGDQDEDRFGPISKIC